MSAARTTLACALFAACLAIGAALGERAPGAEARAGFTVLPPGHLDRVAFARVYQSGDWVVPGEDPQSVGQALAGLEPSWVATLLRFKKNAKVRPMVIDAWETIIGLVRASSPDAQFGVELNALQYRKPAQIVRMMAALRQQLNVDGWTMDFYTPAYRQYPKAVAAGIADAHANGEWIGGNAFRLANTPRVPPGSDFIAVQDFDFKLDLDAVRELAQQAPVVYHLGNTPELPNSDGCRFITNFTTQRRAALLRQRAAQQATYQFRVGYPVLFPACERGRQSRNPTLYTYNAIRDVPMMQTIDGLMDQYEPAP